MEIISDNTHTKPFKINNNIAFNLSTGQIYRKHLSYG